VIATTTQETQFMQKQLLGSNQSAQNITEANENY